MGCPENCVVAELLSLGDESKQELYSGKNLKNLKMGDLA